MNSDATDKDNLPKSASEYDLEAIRALPDWDAADYLTSEQMIAVYLDDCLADGDPALAAHAHATVARARARNAAGDTTANASQ